MKIKNILNSNKCLITITLVLFIGILFLQILKNIAYAIDEQFWVNIQSCPLRIMVNEQKSFIQNLSQGSVTRYQLGCVSLKKDKIELVKDDITQEVNLLPVGSKFGKDVDLLPKPDHGNYLLRCDAPLKVAIIEVYFADGGKWTIKK